MNSEAFTHGDEVPHRHTCDGEDVSPALSWSGPPEGTRALALIVEDPDAPVGTFTHWLAWNIDPLAGGLAEGESAPPRGETTLGSAVGAVRARRLGTAHTATSSGCTPSTPNSTSASAPGDANSTKRSPTTWSRSPNSWPRTSAEPARARRLRLLLDGRAGWGKTTADPG